MNRPDPPDIPRASDDDRLLRRYHEASARDGAQPAPGLRAAVLAQARAQAALARPAANDAQWRWRALGSLAVLGLVGLLVLQFDRASDTERETTLGRPGTDRAAPPVLRTPEPPPPAEMTPSGDRVTRTAPSPRLADAAAQAPAAISVSPTPVPSMAETPSSVQPSLAAPTPIATQTQRSTEPPKRAPASNPFPEDLAASRADRSTAQPAVQAETTPEPPPARTHTAVSDDNGQADTLTDSGPRVGSSSPAPRRAAPTITTPRTLQSNLAISAANRALLLSAAEGSVEDARAALAQGAQINATQAQGRSALMLAALRGDAALVRVLLEAGADTSRTDRDGETAADLAEHAGHTAIATRLRSTPPR